MPIGATRPRQSVQMQRLFAARAPVSIKETWQVTYAVPPPPVHVKHASKLVGAHLVVESVATDPIEEKFVPPASKVDWILARKWSRILIRSRGVQLQTRSPSQTLQQQRRG